LAKWPNQFSLLLSSNRHFLIGSSWDRIPNLWYWFGLSYNLLVIPLPLALSIKECKSEWRGFVAISISLFGEKTATLGTIHIVNGNLEISPGLESYIIRLDQFSGQQSMQNDVKSTIMFYPINNDSFKATLPLVHLNPSDIQR
jgi:hypothetical protein